MRCGDRVIADQRNERLELRPVEYIRGETLARRIGDGASMERELFIGERHPDAAALIFGRIAEQLVHLRPQALLLDEERAEMMAGAAAVAPRCLPADDALVEDEHVDAGARQPPSGAEPGHTAADDDDGSAGRACR